MSVLLIALEWIRVLSGRELAYVYEAPLVPACYVTEEVS